MEWIGITDAAALTMLNEGYLRKLCVEKWAPNGLAKKRKAAGGGKPSWVIRKDAIERMIVAAEAELLRELIAGVLTLRREALGRVLAQVQYERGSTAHQSRIERHSKD